MAVPARKSQAIARPLKVLIPLIQSEIQQGNTAGREHYIQAGKLLIEAKGQVSYGNWGAWLSKNFVLSQRTASDYMGWARAHDQIGRPSANLPTSLHDFTGGRERRREERQSTQHQQFRRILRDLPRDEFVQERQARDQEVQLHRDLADELIDIGYRALATKLHPDRGGSKDAMARLNRVRDELKAIAETRRFI